MITLTPRQQQVYELLIQGYTYQGIAKVLNISKRTVNAHIAAAREATKSANNEQMVYKILTQDCT